MINFAVVLAPGPDATIFQVPNPIGFLKTAWIDAIVGPFLILFPIWILLCTVSLFVRFRRARAVEREQIKWLFYAAGIFVLCYLPTFFIKSYSDTANLWNLLLPIGMSTFPIAIAIAIAILRYRLYDIDQVIHRTLLYTGFLTLVYFDGVVLSQAIFGGVAGQPDLPLIIVSSTLLIAAFFNSLRQRIQNFIDRSFSRRKYDAQLALENFTEITRAGTDLNRLYVELVEIMQEAFQPVSLSFGYTDGRSGIPRGLLKEAGTGL